MKNLTKLRNINITIFQFYNNTKYQISEIMNLFSTVHNITNTTLIDGRK